MVIVRWGMHLGVMDARILVYPLLSLAKRSDWSRRKFSCEGGGGLELILLYAKRVEVGTLPRL